MDLASEIVPSLTTFLDAPKFASLIHPVLSTRMFAPLMSGCQFATLVPNVVAFIGNLGPDKKPKMLKVGPKFFQP
jgi:hypothetical protein